MAAESPITDKDGPERKPEHRGVTIRIDRTEYRWPEEKITGYQIRGLPTPSIPPDRDLFRIVPGHPDRRIEDDDVEEINDGSRFFTVPNTINPGTTTRTR